MAYCNCAAIDVDLGGIKPQACIYNTCLRRKCFVDFNEIEIIDGPGGAIKRFP